MSTLYFIKWLVGMQKSAYSIHHSSTFAYDPDFEMKFFQIKREKMISG